MSKIRLCQEPKQMNLKRIPSISNIFLRDGILHIMRRTKLDRSKFWGMSVLAAALSVPVAFSPVALQADDHHDDHHYKDDKHHDEHVWNDHEDKAYRIWAKENHRKYKDFSKIKETDRDAYWDWRHNHSDSLLKIDIR
jgi:hypothetical protein